MPAEQLLLKSGGASSIQQGLTPLLAVKDGTTVSFVMSPLVTSFVTVQIGQT